MILYHGTNMNFDDIDLSKCAPYKDFGTGFYTTTIWEQAKAMAIRRSRIFGGKPCVHTYEAPDELLSLKSIKIKKFETTSKNRAVFIINNRNRDFKDFENPLCNRDNKYDLVYGPVANDTLTTIIEQYQRGYISGAKLIKEMKYSAPTDQYSFHTTNSIKLLKKVDFTWIE